MRSPFADHKSDTSWGAACSSQITGGPWSRKEQLWHINCLEVCAVFLAAKTFAARNHDPPEDRQHDNSCLHQQTGRNSVPQNEQDSYGYDQAEHLAGVLNTIAKEGSRVMKDRSDWMLDQRVFQSIQT